MTFYRADGTGPQASDTAWARHAAEAYATAALAAAEHAGQDNPAAVQGPLLTGGASGRRGSSGYHSYSHGNGPDDDRPPLDGWVIRAAHWLCMG